MTATEGRGVDIVFDSVGGEGHEGKHQVSSMAGTIADCRLFQREPAQPTCPLASPQKRQRDWCVLESRA
ncbi:MAG: hypothetical protein Ct9H300mP28_20510 [Pseudomonadota bacterium]|nr:MAG: hypothetical protein Ct9H300mP28_20510 [Pseudomonadota bacterium]